MEASFFPFSSRVRVGDGGDLLLFSTREKVGDGVEGEERRGRGGAPAGDGVAGPWPAEGAVAQRASPGHADSRRERGREGESAARGCGRQSE